MALNDGLRLALFTLFKITLGHRKTLKPKRMNRIVTTLSVLLVTAAGAFAQSATEWEIVCDGERTAPLSQVVCLVAADQEDVFNVMLKDSSIDGVSTVAFRKSNGIGMNIAENDATRILEAEGTLRIMNCREGAKIVISDLSGRIMTELTVNGSETEIDIRPLAAGAYIASVDGHSIKFIKK